MKQEHPKDHGWAWCIVIGSFGMHFIVSSSTKCIGVLLTEMRDVFQGSYWALASVHGTAIGLFLGLAPVSNALSIRFTHRAVVFCGGLLGAVAYIGAAFAPSLNVFCVFQGLVAGIAFGLTFGPCVVFVLFYFTKKRGLALGIAQSGAGFGGLVLPIIVNYLASVYGLRGCLLIQAAVLANVCVFAMLLRPVSFYTRGTQPEQNSQENVKNSEIVVDDFTEQCNCYTVEFEIEHRKPLNKHNTKNRSNLTMNDIDVSGDLHNDSDEFYSKESRKFDNSLDGFHEYQIRKTVPEENTLISHTNRKSSGCLCIQNLKKYFNWQIFHNKYFVIYLLAGVASEFAWESSFIMLPSFAEDLGFTKSDGALLPSILGITDFFSRIVGGLFVDRNFISTKTIYLTTLLAMGITALCAPFAHNYTGLVFIAAAYGVYGALTNVLLPIIFVDILGIDNLSTAFGIAAGLQALLIMTVSQALGLLHDMTNSWAMSFRLTGIVALCAFIIAAFVPIISSSLYKVRVLPCFTQKFTKTQNNSCA